MLCIPLPTCLCWGSCAQVLNSCLGFRCCEGHRQMNMGISNEGNEVFLFDLISLLSLYKLSWEWEHTHPEASGALPPSAAEVTPCPTCHLWPMRQTPSFSRCSKSHLSPPTSTGYSPTFSPSWNTLNPEPQPLPPQDVSQSSRVWAHWVQATPSEPGAYVLCSSLSCLKLVSWI